MERGVATLRNRTQKTDASGLRLEGARAYHGPGFCRPPPGAAVAIHRTKRAAEGRTALDESDRSRRPERSAPAPARAAAGARIGRTPALAGRPVRHRPCPG